MDSHKDIKLLSSRKRVERDLTEALQFLRSSPGGKRLQAAEHALTLLMEGKLPRLGQAVFNARFDLREIEPEPVHSISRDNLEAEFTRKKKFSSNSEPTGQVQVNLDQGCVTITLYYPGKIKKNEAALFSACLGEITAATYAALGLDMSGLISLDDQIS